MLYNIYITICAIVGLSVSAITVYALAASFIDLLLRKGDK